MKMSSRLTTTLLTSNPDLKIILEEIPEFEQCFGLTQNDFHFGDVAEHTLAVLDYHCKRFQPNIVERLACLLHDIGKLKTRTVKDGKVHFYNHEYAGEKMSREILTRLGYDQNVIDDVAFIIRNHMRTKQGGDNGERLRDKTLNKILKECGSFDRFKSLMTVIESDNMSHKKEHIIVGQYDALINRVEKLNKY